MIRFQAEQYLEIVQDLTEADFRLKDIYKGEPTAKPMTQENRDFFLKVIERVQKLSEEINLPTLDEFLKTSRQRISWDLSTVDDSIYVTRAMRDILVASVKAHVFLQIAPDKRDLYLAAVNSTAPLAQAYPEVKHELLEAHLCYAMERYSACVHHLMTAVEFSLRKWGRQCKLKTPRPLKLEDWSEILRAAQAKLGQLGNLKRSSSRDRQMKHLSETSGHFSFIKDGWRKHSAHGRQQFDETQAKAIMNHVEAFMRLLAPLPRKTKPILSGLIGLGAALLIPPDSSKT